MTTQEAFKKLDLAIGLGKDRVELKFNQLKKELNEKIRITSNEKLKGIFVSRLSEVDEAYAVLLDYFEPNSVKQNDQEVDLVTELNSENKLYYFYNGNEREGPLKLDELKSKDLKWNTLVWYEGLNEWKEACEIEELVDVFITIPPPVNKQIMPLNDFKPIDEGTLSSSKLEKDDSFKDTANHQTSIYNNETQTMFSNIFSFEGRIRRTEFGFTLIIYIVLWIFIGVLTGLFAIIGIAYIPLVWMLWAQAAKRCHDLGRSGWWQLIPFYVFWLIFEDGEAGINQYGGNPKE